MSDLVERLRQDEQQLRKAAENAGFGGDGVCVRVSDPTELLTDLSQAADEIEALRARLNWAANELLACDYGDNESESEIGWHVYGWRNKDGSADHRIYGPSIDEAIDAELDRQGLARGGGDA